MTGFKSVHSLSALAFLACCTCIAPQVSAGAIVLFNTGVDSGGVALAGGSIDPHWSIVNGPGVTLPVDAFVASHPSTLYAKSSTSGWIWLNANGSGSTHANYTFRMVFDLTGLDPTTASISGSWGVDNNGSIALNGSSAIGTGALSLTGGTVNNFELFHDFTITGGFVAGLNSLDFVAEDDANPGALNVLNLQGTATSMAVPEPGSLAMLGTGLTVLLCSWWKRRDQKDNLGREKP
jgi:PEP-CTERM motif